MVPQCQTYSSAKVSPFFDRACKPLAQQCLEMMTQQPTTCAAAVCDRVLPDDAHGVQLELRMCIYGEQLWAN